MLTAGYQIGQQQLMTEKNVRGIKENPKTTASEITNNLYTAALSQSTIGRRHIHKPTETYCLPVYRDMYPI